MIWQLFGDTAGDKSLLNTIYEVIHKNLHKTAQEVFEAKSNDRSLKKYGIAK